jgi:hypothetical protein
MKIIGWIFTKSKAIFARLQMSPDNQYLKLKTYKHHHQE